jgi:hypothetical protein
MFTFTSIALTLKNDEDDMQVGVWTDGIGVYSDNDAFCEYKLVAGKRYKVTIEEIKK